MPDMSKTGLDKTPSMSGDGSKVKSPMKPYKAKPMSGGKKR